MGGADRKALGKHAEALAAETLEKKGYRIFARNARCPLGELDIVALHGDMLVFVEVRAVSGGRRGHPKESVSTRKQAVLTRTALWYLKKHGWMDRSARFDVITVRMNGGGVPEVEHFVNAFEMVY